MEDMMDVQPAGGCGDAEVKEMEQLEPMEVTEGGETMMHVAEDAEHPNYSSTTSDHGVGVEISYHHQQIQPGSGSVSPSSGSVRARRQLSVSDEEGSSDEEEHGSSQVEVLARKLAAMRETGTLPAHLMDPPQPAQASKLASFDAVGVAGHVLSSKEEDVVILGGAGMSTSAGIPDFRSPGTGLYDNLQKYDLPRPQAIFELDYFKESPAAFYELARELWPGGYAPTPTHLFIKLLHDKGRLLRCFTQNIDSLETAAGLPSEKTVAAHGNFDSATCVDTGESVPVEEVRAAVLDDPATGWCKLRDKYGGLVKPDIVFFGEGLPRRFFDLASTDLARARTLLVVGTSLSVQPFASLLNHVDDDCIRVLVNRDPVGLRDKRIPRVIAQQLGVGGFDFDDPDRNYRDVALLGDCDAQIFALADALGWRHDLDRLVADSSCRFATLIHRRTRAAQRSLSPPLLGRRRDDRNDEEEDHDVDDVDEEDHNDHDVPGLNVNFDSSPVTDLDRPRSSATLDGLDRLDRSQHGVDPRQGATVDDRPGSSDSQRPQLFPCDTSDPERRSSHSANLPAASVVHADLLARMPSKETVVPQTSSTTLDDDLHLPDSDIHHSPGLLPAVPPNGMILGGPPEPLPPPHLSPHLSPLPLPSPHHSPHWHPGPTT